LFPLDLVERVLQLDHNIVESLNLGELVGLRREPRCTRFKTGFTIGRHDEDDGVRDR
jgi:hypothetical protein